MRHIYREFAAHPALARVVECYWTITAPPGGNEPADDLVLPDGCMDALFDLTPAAARCPQVVGTMTRALPVSSTGPARFVGIRFRPGGATPFVPVAASELTDLAAPLECFWGSTAVETRERLAVAPAPEGWARVLDGVLRARLSRHEARLDRRIQAAAGLIGATGGRVGVDALAGAAELGPRQLERRFHAVVGIGPKLACTVQRFREAVATLHREPGVPLSRLAFRTGYADQPHLTRAFKRFAGLPPGAYRRRFVPSRAPG